MTDASGDDRPDWLRWDGFEALDDAAAAALALVEAGEYAAGHCAMAAVFERAVAAPRRDDGWLLALAGAYERVLGTTADAVAEAAGAFRRAEDALAPMAAPDRSRALRLRARFVSDVAADEALGAAALVTVLAFVDETLRTFGDVDDPEAPTVLAVIRRVRIQLGIRARVYPTRQDVYAAFDAEAALLAQEALADLVSHRVVLLDDAADFAIDQHEPEIAAEYLATAEHDAARAPRADAMLWSIRSRRIAILLDQGRLEEALQDSLRLADEPSADEVMRVINHGIIARAVGARLCGLGRDEQAHALEDRLLLRFVRTPDPEVRAAAVRELRWSASDDGADASYSVAERAALRRAVAAFEADDDPLVSAEVDAAMLNWASAESHLGAHGAALEALSALAPRLRARIAAGDTDVRWTLARALLVAHFAHAGVGDRAAALRDLAEVAADTAAFDADPRIRAVRAQAAYWRARLLREHGDAAGSRAVGQALLGEFAHDPQDDARVWASASLLSTWLAPDADAATRAAAFRRHGELFAADAHPEIRAREIRRRIGQASDLRDTGEVTAALAILDAILAEAEAEVADDDAAAQPPAVVAAVQAASDLRAVFAVLVDGSGPAVPAPAGPRMADIDRLNSEANAVSDADPAAACMLYHRAADLAATAADPFARLAGIIALDNLTSTLLETGDVPNLLTAAERMVRTCDVVAALPLPPLVARRVVGERATGLTRWAMGLRRIGDVSRAIQLCTLVADAAHPRDVTDDDHITAMSQSMYNRAVMLDDRGDLTAAADAYATLAAAHRHWPDSLPRRIRLVKGHRNRGAVLTRLGRLAEAADDYRAAVDLARGSEHPELRSRIVDSLAQFAELATRSGAASAAVERLDWALGGGVRLEPAETKRLRGARTVAAKATRRR